MEAYSGFAQVYDFLMKDVEYDEWVHYIEAVFAKKNIKPIKILELACGTGNITTRLAQKKYSLTGVDLSSEMLALAQSKAQDFGLKVNYINQNIESLEINEKYDCVLCLCDGVNYIIDEERLLALFIKSKELLNENGVFIFDISSYYKISNILGNNTYAENHEEVSYIWENYFDEDSSICELDLTIFVKQHEKDLYNKLYETHIQRAYTEKEILNKLEICKFSEIEVYDNYSFNRVKNTSERINFICKK